MIMIGANGDRITYGIKHYNVDTETDLAKINTNQEIMGTTAFIIETSTYYMLNGSKIWKQINPYGNSSSTGSKEIIYDGGGA